MPKQLMLTKRERQLVLEYRGENRTLWTQAIDAAKNAAEFSEMTEADRREIKRQVGVMCALRRDGRDYYEHQAKFGLVDANGVAWDE